MKIIDYSVGKYELYEPPFNLHSELNGLMEEMRQFFPYLSHKHCRELNKAIKLIKSIQNDIKIEEYL